MSVALVLALVPAPQIAPSALDLADARCAAALRIVADDAKTPEEAKIRLALTAMYYAGRLSTRNDGGVTASTIKDIERQLDANTTEQAVKKCTDDWRAFIDAGLSKE